MQQVHSDFKRQFLELTVDKLLEQFVLNKYTGLEKPGKCTADWAVEWFAARISADLTSITESKLALDIVFLEWKIRWFE